ncbi:multidrug ABC transporter substrate-binding protein [Capsulimonas corticalis]|uniref:Multidrug ABC transporter substrate-binding protein n=1 Tax=Capsulimonas corticalis TaxID=2219043 RepID=A0A402D0Z9_9BACT|nr:ABC transporter permease [Capsulimonas corticalis]BDI33492.1 multidrug ABC transporter substrate-binding protein [Capsulimonas corticalis]
MAFFESLRVALEALWANKLRTILTMLGVIIGVSSVILMIAIVQGARQKLIAQLESNGSNQIFAFYDPKPGSAAHGGVDGLVMPDVTAIARQCTLIGPVSPTANTGVQASAGTHTKSLTLIGVLAAYQSVSNITVARGRFIQAVDDDTWSKACVIGRKVREDLFGTADPIGREIVCMAGDSKVSLTVVGVLADKDRAFDTDPNNSVFLSLRSVQKRFTGSDKLNGFSTKSLDVTQTNAAADEVWSVLQRRHPTTITNYVVDTQQGLLKQLDTFIAIFQLVLGGIGGLALLTGGIGIMNIMLVSVTERTREIGIRKAVGATPNMILLQFVVEAVVVSGFGGALGIAQSYGIVGVINALPQKVIHAFIPLWGVGLGFGFAMAVGLFFGIYPAWRASRLDPITALRYE